MNNLIIAVIAIAFAALIMTAGINYLTPTHAILNTEATNSTIEIDQMMADYNSLKMNIGHTPSFQDYEAVYGNGAAGPMQTVNAAYTVGIDDAGNQTVARTSFLQGIQQMQVNGNANTVTSGWVFEHAQAECGVDPVTGKAGDCFKMTVNATAPNAQQICQALTLAQKRMMAMTIDDPNHNCN